MAPSTMRSRDRRGGGAGAGFGGVAGAGVGAGLDSSVLIVVCLVWCLARKTTRVWRCHLFCLVPLCQLIASLIRNCRFCSNRLVLSRVNPSAGVTLKFSVERTLDFPLFVNDRILYALASR
jgi:hypothetical protein